MEALKLVRLPDKYERRINQLSGGERQRVALARSLVMQPDILLLDEPLGSLDEQLRMSMQIELMEIHRKTGCTFILVTHSQEEALTMSHRIVLMRHGMIEQIGTSRELFEQPETSFAAIFMGVENVLQGQIAAVDGNVATVRVGNSMLKGRLQACGENVIGRAAFLAVRAEHLRFGQTAGYANRVEGRPGEPVYKGKYLDFPFDCPLGTLTVRQWQADGGGLPDSHVSFPLDHCVVGLLADDEPVQSRVQKGDGK